MVTTNEKHTIDTQNGIERNAILNDTKETKQKIKLMHL